MGIPWVSGAPCPRAPRGARSKVAPVVTGFSSMWMISRFPIAGCSGGSKLLGKCWEYGEPTISNLASSQRSRSKILEYLGLFVCWFADTFAWQFAGFHAIPWLQSFFLAGTDCQQTIQIQTINLSVRSLRIGIEEWDKMRMSWDDIYMYIV